MIRVVTARSSIMWCKPRASGDDPVILVISSRGGCVNPARAGMIPSPGSWPTCSPRKPRASGDDPAQGPVVPVPSA